MKAITLYDVARVAGVSYQTVSRVINDAEHVSARTREKVRQAMAALHYVPNRGAQQLAGKRTRTLGLMTSDLALHAPSQIASAVKSRAVEQGASVLISMVEQPAQCQAALQELLAQRVEALLVNVPLEDAQAEMLQEMASPTPVLFLDVSPTARVNSLVFNAEQGAGTGAEHLLSLGHQRIALLAGPESSVSARARLAGWKTTLARAGVEAFAVVQGDWSAASGYEKGHQLWRARSCRRRSSSLTIRWRLAFYAPVRKKALRYRGRSRLSGLMIRLTARGFHLRSPPFGRRSARPVSAAWSG